MKKFTENIPLNAPAPKEKKPKKDENPEIKDSKMETKQNQQPSHHSQAQNPAKKLKQKK